MTRLCLVLTLCLGWLGISSVQEAHAQRVSDDSEFRYPSLSTRSGVERTGTKDVAVIVAIEDYLLLPPVRGASSNANDWETFFRTGLGLSKVYVLSNTQASREQMQRFAAQAAAEVGEGATLWFVFIGHGAPAKDGLDGMLVGVDAQQDPDSLVARGLRQQELLDALNVGKQAQTVLVVDACFSGRASDGSALAPAQPVVPMNIKPAFTRKTVILAAAQASEFAGSLPGVEKPAFSYLLLGALRGWAGSSEVSAEQALWFTQRVLRSIPARFQQTPSLVGEGSLVLVRNALEPDPGLEKMVRRSDNVPAVQSTASALDGGLPGLLSITSNPSGLVVTVGGEVVGKTPVRRKQVAAGTHQVIVGEGCDAKHLDNVRITSQKDTRLDVRIERFGVRIASTNTNGGQLGSEILADGILLGRAPQRVHLPRCTRKLEMRSDGYQTFERALNLEQEPLPELNIILKKYGE